MARYEVTVHVEYVYEVEADSLDEAEMAGWDYEDWRFTASVNEIQVAELDDEEEEGEE